MESLVDRNLFVGAYQGKSVFVTGHTGFKGSWLVTWLHMLGARVTGFSRSPHTNPSHIDLLKFEGVSEIGDISDYRQLEEALLRAQPEVIFHLAAQALVIPSYQNPRDTYGTNVMGSLNILEAAKLCSSLKAIVCVTTDKVYENLNREDPYSEKDILGGYDPYATSKSCTELLIRSHRKSFFPTEDFNKSHHILLAVARAGNVIGGGDWADYRLIPDLVKAASRREVTSIRSPQAVRPWQHVLESLSGYLLLGKRLLDKDVSVSGAWNFGPEMSDHVNVGEVVEKMSHLWQGIKFKVEEPEEKFHEAKILKLNCDKAKKELNWKPIWNLDQGLAATVTWYKEFYENQFISTESDILGYVESAQEQGAEWAK